MTLSTFIPDDQQEKLPLDQDAAKTPAHPQSDRAEAAADRRREVAEMNSTIAVRNKLGRQRYERRRGAARHARDGLTTLAKADRRARARQDAFVQPLSTCSTTCAIASAKRSPRDNCRPISSRDWVTPARLRASSRAKGDANDNRGAREIRTMPCSRSRQTPPSGPISILEAGRPWLRPSSRRAPAP